MNESNRPADERFIQPTEVNDLDIAFGGQVNNLMPLYSELSERASGWGERLFSDWFFCGIKSTDGLIPKDGIDKRKALRHIKSVMGSFEPSHEHKTAGCAYLFERWFEESSKWERAK